MLKRRVQGVSRVVDFKESPRLGAVRGHPGLWARRGLPQAQLTIHLGGIDCATCQQGQSAEQRRCHKHHIMP